MVRIFLQIAVLAMLLIVGPGQAADPTGVCHPTPVAPAQKVTQKSVTFGLYLTQQIGDEAGNQMKAAFNLSPSKINALKAWNGKSTYPTILEGLTLAQVVEKQYSWREGIESTQIQSSIQGKFDSLAGIDGGISDQLRARMNVPTKPTSPIEDLKTLVRNTQAILPTLDWQDALAELEKVRDLGNYTKESRDRAALSRFVNADNDEPILDVALMDLFEKTPAGTPLTKEAVIEAYAPAFMLTLSAPFVLQITDQVFGLAGFTPNKSSDLALSAKVFNSLETDTQDPRASSLMQALVQQAQEDLVLQFLGLKTIASTPEGKQKIAAVITVLENNPDFMKSAFEFLRDLDKHTNPNFAIQNWVNTLPQKAFYESLRTSGIGK